MDKSWDDYRVARNKAVTLVRRSKRDFHQSAFENNDIKSTWKTIKSLLKWISCEILCY